VWGNLLLLAPLETSMIILYGILWVFMVLMSTMKKVCYGMNWQVCLIGRIFFFDEYFLIGGIFHGGLGDFNIIRSLSERASNS